MNNVMTKFAALVRGVIVSIMTRLGAFGMIAVAVACLFSDSLEELWAKVKGDVYGAICDLVREKTGLVLVRDDPLSDASIAAALTARSGILISTVKDPDVLMHDLSNHAAGIIKDHTGVPLTDLLSAEQIKVDVVNHAENLVYERTGLDVRGSVSFDEVQKKIGAAIERRLAELVVERLRAAAEKFANPEATLDDLLAMVYRAQEANKIKVRDVALGTAASLVVAAYARMSTPMKRRVDAFRRRAQNREAQRRFRQRHGLRMRYEKLPKGGRRGKAG